MKRIVVLGAGQVGRAIAADLCREYDVTAVDIDEANLAALAEKYPLRTTPADLSRPKEIRKVIEDCDLVIGAVPGFMGYQTLETVVQAGKHMVDISFFDEDTHDPFKLDQLAQKQQVTVIIDCGVAPGMSNMILGYHQSIMQVERFECYVGGLPVVRTWPYQYKAPFSPVDVLEEYTRPARIMENGRLVVKPALSDPEFLEFREIGTLEAFNTDGLRTLLKTMAVANMKEKTLRYPGHLEYIKVLRETGLFDREAIEVNGVTVRPIDVTAKLLFPRWKPGREEKEFTVMKIIIEGEEGGNPVRYSYDLLDRYDEAAGFSSMARTTGYTCTAAARLLLNGHFTRKGICPPEYVGAERDCFERILKYFDERNIHYRRGKRAPA